MQISTTKQRPNFLLFPSSFQKCNKIIVFHSGPPSRSISFIDYYLVNTSKSIGPSVCDTCLLPVFTIEVFGSINIDYMFTT